MLQAPCGELAAEVALHVQRVQVLNFVLCAACERSRWPKRVERSAGANGAGALVAGEAALSHTGGQLGVAVKAVCVRQRGVGGCAVVVVAGHTVMTGWAHG